MPAHCSSIPGGFSSTPPLQRAARYQRPADTRARRGWLAKQAGRRLIHSSFPGLVLTAFHDSSYLPLGRHRAWSYLLVDLDEQPQDREIAERCHADAFSCEDFELRGLHADLALGSAERDISSKCLDRDSWRRSGKVQSDLQCAAGGADLNRFRIDADLLLGARRDLDGLQRIIKLHRMAHTGLEAGLNDPLGH